MILPDSLLEPDQTAPTTGRVPNVVVIYEDALARHRATTLQNRVAHLVRPDKARAASWNVKELSKPPAFLQAAFAAMLAEVIVIAVVCADALPPALCEWISVWSRCGASATACCWRWRA